LATAAPREINFAVGHWTAEDGLPESTVTSLAQTPDGFLWGGTYSGPVRYGGETFRVFDAGSHAALEGLRIDEMRCDASGRLWIAGSGGELVCYEDGQFHRVEAGQGLPNGQAGKLGTDLQGELWVKARSQEGFYRYCDGVFESMPTSISAANIDRFVADRHGLAWAVHEQERTLIQFTAGGPKIGPLTAADGTEDRTLGRFFRLQDGSVGLTSSKGVYALEAGEWRMRVALSAPVAGQALDGVEDWDGNYWVSYAGVGLVFFGREGPATVVSLPELSKQPYLRTLALGREGNLWAAGQDGLYRIRRNSFQQLATVSQSESEAATCVVEDIAGRIHCVYPRGCTVVDGGACRFTPHPNKNEEIWSAAPSASGGLYLGCVSYGNHDQSIYRLSDKGDLNRLGTVRGYPRAIVEQTGGVLWVAAEDGVWSLDGGAFHRATIPGAVGDYTVYAMAEDSQHRMLVGAFGHGLFRRETDGAWVRLAGMNDLGATLIVSLFPDDDGSVWAATDRGLARWKNGRWFAFSDCDGVLPSWVRRVISDDDGGLWLASQFGVVRVEREHLVGIADGTREQLDGARFDRSDGLPSATCVVGQHSMLKSSDGRIWVATAKGVGVVDPARWVGRRNRMGVPNAYLTGVLLDDKLAGPLDAFRTASMPMIFPPNPARIEIRYSAVNLTANSKTHFRYKLDGFDADWVSAQELRSAVYHRLPPGEYRFRLVASAPPQDENDSAPLLSFVVMPHWWQTFWFKFAGGASVVGGLWCCRWLKLRQLQRERRRHEEFSRLLIHSQEAERKRIANELHDSLGQNLLVAKNRLFLVRERAASSEEKARLGEVAETLTAALDEARSISHRLRPFQLERLGLTQAIRSMVDEFVASTRLPVHAQVEAVNGLLSGEAEVMVYRILQEALSNILKHAEASEVHVRVGRKDQCLCLRVQDDGRGFDVDQMFGSEEGPRGLGLAGFDERARMLGGRFVCESTPGQGTCLTFEIPLPDYGTREATH